MLSIRLFGSFAVQRDGQYLPGLEAHKVQELLAYLLIYRERPHPRETLAALLWGESTTAQSKKWLRQALWQLQTALDVAKMPGGEGALLTEPDLIQFNARSDVWLDVADFEHAFAQSRGVAGEALDDVVAGCLRDAIALYRGDLLEGWYADWCLFERERLQNAYLMMLDKLMAHCETCCDYEIGIDYGTRILRCNRAREHTYQHLMRLYYLAGDRATALRQYERCVAALAEELSVRPSARTTALYDQIRADRLDDPPTHPAVTAAAPVAAVKPLRQLLAYLRQLQARLTEMDQQIEESLETIDRSHPPDEPS